MDSRRAALLMGYLSDPPTPEWMFWFRRGQMRFEADEFYGRSFDMFCSWYANFKSAEEREDAENAFCFGWEAALTVYSEKNQ